MIDRFNTLVFCIIILISNVLSLESTNSIYADQSQGMTLPQRNEQKIRKKNEILNKLIEQRANIKKELEDKNRINSASKISSNNRIGHMNINQRLDSNSNSNLQSNNLDDILNNQKQSTNKEYHSKLNPNKIKQTRNIKTLTVNQLPFESEGKEKQIPLNFIANQEKLAELYYHNQKGEIRQPMSGSFPFLNANFPCIQGTNVIGLDTPSSIFDGHKYACGIHRINGRPIVYSFGSDKRQDFEEGILLIREDSLIFVFELEENAQVPKMQQLQNIKYMNFGLGYSTNSHQDVRYKYKTLSEIMQIYGHTYIDVIKMDIEGAEWSFIKKERYLLKFIGQIIVEVHTNDDRFVESKNQPPLNLLIAFESMNMRLFHVEGNFAQGSHCCSEWSFIQKDWSQWEKNKNRLR